MSELPEDVPALSAEASEFLKRHASTGEPSPRALERVKARLPTPRTRALRVARAVAPLAAAVALIALAGWGWSVRQRVKADAPVAEAPKQPVAEPPLPVTTLVDESKPSPAPASQDAVPLEDPKQMELREVYLRAYMLRDSEPAKSRQLLEQIVDEGDPRWEAVQKAQARLRDLGATAKSARKDAAASDKELQDLYSRASVTRDSSPAEAAKLFKQVVDASAPGSELNRKAKAELARLSSDLDDLFQRAYIIRDAQPQEAAKLFRRIVDSKDADPELRRKAKLQLEAMKP